MAAANDQAAQQQHEHLQQQEHQRSSALLATAGLQEALLGRTSVCQDYQVLLRLMQACRQLHVAAVAQCAGQLAVSVVLPLPQSSSTTQACAAWLQRHAGLLQELHVKLRCCESDGAAVLHCLQEQEQQLQQLQCLALDSISCVRRNSLQDGWADPLLPHLPVRLRRLQITGSKLTVQQDALASLSRLQQLTQITISSAYTPQWHYLPAGLRSLDLADYHGSADTHCNELFSIGPQQDALAPLARLQQLTELRLGSMLPEQLEQLPSSLQHLDVTLVATLEQHVQAAAWLQQHAAIVRRLALDGETDVEWRFWDEVFDEEQGSLSDTWAPALAGMAAAFDAVATAAAAEAVLLPVSAAPPPTALEYARPQASSSNVSSGSDRSREGFTLQSLRVLRMPWVLEGCNLRTLPACSLTELECYIDFECEQAVDALSRLTALRSLIVTRSNARDGDTDQFHLLSDQHDSALAPLSALLQLTQLQLAHVRAPQLGHLRLPHLLHLGAIVARLDSRHDQQDQAPQLSQLELSHLSSLTLLEICSSALLQGDNLPGSLRAVTWDLTAADCPWRNPETHAAALSMQPLLQLGALEKLNFTFHDIRPELCCEGLWHDLVSLTTGSWQNALGSEFEVWRMPASTEEQGFVSGEQPAAAEVFWGAMPLKSVRLLYQQAERLTGGMYSSIEGLVRMPAAAVQALCARQITELAITGGNMMQAHLELEVTPAQLAAVLQRLPSLQQLQLVSFGMLCDHLATAEPNVLQQQQQQQQPSAQQQQQGMQPYHSTAGVAALLSAIGSLSRLQDLEMHLPLKLQAAAVPQVEAALGQLLPSIRLLDAEACGHWLRSD